MPNFVKCLFDIKKHAGTRFLILEKKNYQAKLLCVFQYLHINLNVLRNFVTLYWATSWTAQV